MADLEGSSQRLAKFPAFDGFRGVAVLVVVFSHLPQVVDSELYSIAWKLDQAPRTGYVALDIFFAISGFFITRLLLLPLDARHTAREFRVTPALNSVGQRCSTITAGYDGNPSIAEGGACKLLVKNPDQLVGGVIRLGMNVRSPGAAALWRVRDNSGARNS